MSTKTCIRECSQQPQSGSNPPPKCPPTTDCVWSGAGTPHRNEKPPLLCTTWVTQRQNMEHKKSDVHKKFKTGDTDLWDKYQKSLAGGGGEINLKGAQGPCQRAGKFDSLTQVVVVQGPKHTLKTQQTVQLRCGHFPASYDSIKVFKKKKKTMRPLRVQAALRQGQHFARALGLPSAPGRNTGPEK